MCAILRFVEFECMWKGVFVSAPIFVDPDDEKAGKKIVKARFIKENVFCFGM